MSLRIGSSEESSEFSEEKLSDQDSGTDVSRRDSEHTDDSTLWGSEEHGLWASSKQYESPTTITARGVEFDIVNRRGESENSSSKTSSPTSSQSSSESGAAFARRVQQSVTANGKVSLPSSQRPANPGPGPAKAGLDKEQEAADIGDIYDLYGRDDGSVSQGISQAAQKASKTLQPEAAQESQKKARGNVGLPASPRPQKASRTGNPIKSGLPAGPRDKSVLRSATQDRPIQTRPRDQRDNPLKTRADLIRAGWLPASVHHALPEEEQDQAAIEHEEWLGNLPADKGRSLKD